jgi:tryptophan-rich sensory protein
LADPHLKQAEYLQVSVLIALPQKDWVGRGSEMVFTVESCTRLVAWTALVMFEVFTLSRSKRNQYDKEMRNLNMVAYQIPSWVFPMVWYTLKTLIVLSMFFWAEYAVNVDDWTFPTVFALVFALIVLSKFWMPLFFDNCAYATSLGLAMVLFALSLAAMIIMIISNNEGTLWALPFALWVPVMAWYGFAVLLNFEWYRMKCGWYQGTSCWEDEERGGGGGAKVVYVISTTPTMVDEAGKVAAKEHHGKHPPGKHRYGHPHGQHGHTLVHPVRDPGKGE